MQPPRSPTEFVVRNVRVSRSVEPSVWIQSARDCECYPEQTTIKRRRASPVVNGNIESFLDSVRMRNCLTTLYLDVSGCPVQSQRILVFVPHFAEPG